MNPGQDLSNAGKKAVHVKWQGKTIALGTFPSDEAEEKCAKAKALTRAWRSSMRPKPTREWVIVELERLGVRVVSGGRTGRKADSGDDDGGDEDNQGMATAFNIGQNGNVINLNHGMMGMPGSGLGAMNAMGNPNLDLDQSENSKRARRHSSIGLSMLLNNEPLITDRTGSLSSMSGMMPGLGAMDREYSGGGAAAAYNAMKDDFYKQQADQRRGSLMGGDSGRNSFKGMPAPTNPNEHYQMLKLHHMNLLNEIQETTLMINLYQQQFLQQQQQQLMQQQQGDPGPSLSSNNMLDCNGLQLNMGMQQPQQMPIQQGSFNLQQENMQQLQQQQSNLQRLQHNLNQQGLVNQLNPSAINGAYMNGLDLQLKQAGGFSVNQAQCPNGETSISKKRQLDHSDSMQDDSKRMKAEV